MPVRRLLPHGWPAFGGQAVAPLRNLCQAYLRAFVPLCLLLAGCGGASDPSADAAGGAEAGYTEHRVSAPQAPAVEPSIDGRGMNVILVSVDTTRADHLGCYGHTTVKTPNIDRFAAEGTRFAWCISSAPLTLPSHATMLTGSYPFVHGARDNGIFFVRQENVALPEIFREAGYATHAEVAAPVLNAKYGLDQGFDTYGDVVSGRSRKKLVVRDPIRLEDAEAEDPGKPLIELETPEIETDRKADDVTRRGVELLTAAAKEKRPFFMFLHYFDPHWPHEAPERFSKEIKDSYLAEISFFDEQFGVLMDSLRDLGLASRTLVILVSDHGEGRGEHGEYKHSTGRYDSTLHVPLIVSCPGTIPAGRVVESQVRLLDLAPTIVEFARLPRTEQMQGASLLPLLADHSRALDLPCYAETLVPQNSLNYSPLRAVRRDDWKYVLAPRPELYDLDDDPKEIFNLAVANADFSAEMRQELWDIIADSPAPPGGRGAWRTPDEDEWRKLAALGYVSSKTFLDQSLAEGSELDHFEPVGMNPRDRIEVIELWAAGFGAYKIGRYEDAERLYRRFAELEPQHPLGASYLGRVLMQLERYDEALEWFRKAVALDPSNFIDFRMMGTLLSVTNRYAEASEAYRKAIAINAHDYVSLLNLGIILTTERRYEEALGLFDLAMRESPDEPALRFHRGLALRFTDKAPEAIAEFTESIRLNPTYGRAYEQLAVTRHKTGQTRLAFEGLAEAIAAMPDEPTLYHAAGQIYADVNDLEKAGDSFAKVVELLPDNQVARHNLGSNLVLRERYAEGIVHLEKSLELDAEFTAPLFYLARAYEGVGRPAEAERMYDRILEKTPRYVAVYPAVAHLRALRGDHAGAVDILRRGYGLLPDNVSLANDLAWHLATAPDDGVRNGAEAVRLAEYANALKGGESFNELDTLAAAYAEVGRWPDAVAAAERALSIVRQTGMPELADPVSARLELFKQAIPYREP